MPKLKSRKGKGQYALYSSESRLQKNREAKRARHAKRHPNDTESLARAGSSVRKAPRSNGNYPEQKVYVYDGAGRKTLMPSFVPYIPK